MRLASAVMFVAELDRSVEFYSELLEWDIRLRDNTVALLVGPDSSQLYLRAVGSRAAHPLGQVGIQYLIWTADGVEDLARCERVLRARSTQVTRKTADDFTVVEGRGPDDVPVLVTYPGPDEARRHKILHRIYEW